MSITDVERGLIAGYAGRVLSRADLSVRVLRQVLYWLNDRTELLSLPLPEALAKSIGSFYSTGFSLPDFERAYAQSRTAFIANLEAIAAQTEPPEPVAGNITMLVRELSLPPGAERVLVLLASSTRYDQVQYFIETLAESLGTPTRVVSALTGEPARVIESLLMPGSELSTSGLLQIADTHDIAGPAGRYSIPARINACLDRSFDGFPQMRHALLGDALTADIVLDDYDHLAGDRDLMCRLIEGALASEARGINVLLYGPPGTGKTELTKVVAKAAGAMLYGAGEEVGFGGEADRTARLGDLVFSLRLLSGSKRVVLLFDEMEDVAWQLMKRGGSKVYLNRLLETNAVPIFWTSNNIHEIDPALLRRMTLAVELRMPPASQRRRILARLAERQHLPLSEREVDQLSRRLQATPAVLENALRAARLAGGGAEAVERAGLGIIRAVTGIPSRKSVSFPEFVPELMCASMNLVELADRLVKGGNRAFSLCLSGPPGTGKSAFARYLARRLGIEVMHKRASDLLGAFVGESEKRIAEAFEEAREAGSLLIFDEADSLLHDRTQAVRSWEITQVNEMLTWMEEHPFPVCFTTNLMDRLDAASLRRFTFHVRFEFLNRLALERAFDAFFRMVKVPAEGLRLQNLTPGDFAQARKQADVLGIASDPAAVVELLAEISRAKPGAAGPIGFVN